jgi:hypothetical protein
MLTAVFAWMNRVRLTVTEWISLMIAVCVGYLIYKNQRQGKELQQLADANAELQAQKADVHDDDIIVQDEKGVQDAKVAYEAAVAALDGGEKKNK